MFRLTRRLGREPIANAIQADPATLTRVENGQGCLTIESVLLMAEHLNCDPIALFSMLTKKRKDDVATDWDLNDRNGKSQIKSVRASYRQ
jgi:hypothetical protein